MSWRFQKRVKILPGVTLNLSRKDVSTSVGVKGARMTFVDGRRRTTIGIPSTGLSQTQIDPWTAESNGGGGGAAIDQCHRNCNCDRCFLLEWWTVNPQVLGSSPTRGAGRGTNVTGPI
jgi:hypothetical protein